MLERIQLTNFQKHKRLRLVFDPNVTVIVGPSDRGKSSIIRAIRWLMTNRPLGEEFINWDEPGQRCEVRASIDGHMVARAKGKDENIYELDGKVFRSFGADVPAELRAVFNTVDLNFSDQLDDPYWFKEPPAQVSRNLNSIVNLDIIDETLGTLSASRKKAAATLEVCQTRLVAAEARVESFRYVGKVDASLREVERLDDVSYALATKTKALRELCEAARAANVAGREAAGAATAGRAVVSLGLRAIAARHEYNVLKDHGDRINAAKQAAASPVPDIKLLEGLFNRAQAARAAAATLRNLYNGATLAERNLANTANELAEAKNDFKQKVGSTCPICNKPMTWSV